ncbi:Methionine aminopeptidase 1D, chloroplastic/mitochondrial [Neolecta irregularis DAH-3]|uniref:Methionine aminopeptidase n=1 Tax=Neolecta irregularis (strain DAH-3) TaxID=1198029 RepID=A0A1U7LPI9_NEOID|nr:Methionine aminopeptidase 1D, chloroplastic/mitochondrial [Neolecta irregularis DAH-3]|eukprot:OLL24567.1 Methionine aminopeptidase 1D, chloroplastic/mitochondrial [Neolecta irregularis DAH-3]
MRPWLRDPLYRRIAPKSLRPLPRPASFFPARIRQPHYVRLQGSSPWRPGIRDIRENQAAVDSLRYTGALAAACLAHAASLLAPGVTTQAVEQQVRRWAERRNVYPSPLGYNGFPAALCTSINNVVAHGIPDETALVNGDIVNLDITLYGSDPAADTAVHADTSATFSVGQCSPHSARLMAAAERALAGAIRVCGPGVPYREIGRAVDKVASDAGFETLPELCGHGIGEEFHQFPVVAHTFEPDNQETMQPGHVFTIEPQGPRCNPPSDVVGVL